MAKEISSLYAILGNGGEVPVKCNQNRSLAKGGFYGRVIHGIWLTRESKVDG